MGRKRQMNGGYPASYRAGERPVANVDIAPNRLAPGPQGMPYAGFAPADARGRASAFGQGSAAQVASERMGPALSIIPSNKVPDRVQDNPQPGGFEGWGRTPGKLMHAAIHRPE